MLLIQPTAVFIFIGFIQRKLFQRGHMYQKSDFSKEMNSGEAYDPSFYLGFSFSFVCLGICLYHQFEFSTEKNDEAHDPSL